MVEPATGRQFSLAAAPYDGVEAVWNARNFWACLQMPEPHSDSRARPADLACDLSGACAWEALWEESVRPHDGTKNMLLAGQACFPASPAAWEALWEGAGAPPDSKVRAGFGVAAFMLLANQACGLVKACA